MQDEPRHDDRATGDERARERAPESPEHDPETDPGAEGGEHPDAAPLPFAPHPDDDSPLGDTDQHSDA